jgi:hypothetical protein
MYKKQQQENKRKVTFFNSQSSFLSILTALMMILSCYMSFTIMVYCQTQAAMAKKILLDHSSINTTNTYL